MAAKRWLGSIVTISIGSNLKVSLSVPSAQPGISPHALNRWEMRQGFLNHRQIVRKRSHIRHGTDTDNVCSTCM